MPNINPNALSERDFTKALRGYSIPEVDNYISRVLENYTALYKENIELEKRLAETQARLEAATAEENAIQYTLQNAKKMSESIIEEAYIKADEVLGTIHADCESILRTFRSKLEAEQENLRKMKESVIAFKQELFEKYRVHIELVEQLSPAYDYAEELSADEYVDQVIQGLKRQIAAQYSVSMEDLKEPESILAARNAQMAAAKNEPSETQKRSGVPSIEELLENDDVLPPEEEDDDTFPAI